MDDADIYYWAARAAEEKRLAASLPKGRSADIHGILADLYEQAAQRKMETVSSGGERNSANYEPSETPWLGL